MKKTFIIIALALASAVSSIAQEHKHIMTVVQKDGK